MKNSKSLQDERVVKGRSILNVLLLSASLLPIVNNSDKIEISIQ